MRVFILALCLLGAGKPALSEVVIDQYGSAQVVKGDLSSFGPRAARRVGLGLMAGGLAGIFGADLEINFTQQTGILGGAGYSTDFRSLFLGIKHRFYGEDFSLYGTGGMARWFANGSDHDVGKTTPGFVADRFLSDTERRRGEFNENLIFAGVGLQYFKARGAWAGSSLYAEVVGLVDLDDLVFAPNAALGYRFYF